MRWVYIEQATSIPSKHKIKRWSNKFVIHDITNDQFSNKSMMAEKKIKMADLLRFFASYVNNLTLVAQ